MELRASKEEVERQLEETMEKFNATGKMAAKLRDMKVCRVGFTTGADEELTFRIGRDDFKAMVLKYFEQRLDRLAAEIKALEQRLEFIVESLG